MRHHYTYRAAWRNVARLAGALRLIDVAGVANTVARLNDRAQIVAGSNRVFADYMAHTTKAEAIAAVRKFWQSLLGEKQFLWHARIIRRIVKELTPIGRAAVA